MAHPRDGVLAQLIQGRPEGLGVCDPDADLVNGLKATVREKLTILGPTNFLFHFCTEGSDTLYRCNMWLSGVQAPDDPSLDPFFSLPTSQEQDNLYNWLAPERRGRTLKVDFHYANMNYWIVGIAMRRTGGSTGW